MGADSPDAVAELRRELEQYRREVEELRNAKPEEKAAAREDVADAEDDVRRAAKNAGLSVEQYQRALNAAKRASFLEDHGDSIREIVNAEIDRLVEEQRKAEQDDGTDTDDDAPKPAAKKKAAKPEPDDEKPDPPAPEPDTAPHKPHWSERSLSELV